MIYNCNSTNGFSVTAFCSKCARTTKGFCHYLPIFNLVCHLQYGCVLYAVCEQRSWWCYTSLFIYALKYFLRSSSTRNYCTIAHECNFKAAKKANMFLLIFSIFLLLMMGALGQNARSRILLGRGVHVLCTEQHNIRNCRKIPWICLSFVFVAFSLRFRHELKRL